MDVIREILQYLHYNPLSTREEIRVGVNFGESDATLKRLIALAVKDANKRTARITSNALLIANGYCPLSFRTVDSIDYKKAMLIFYEQNNLYAFKQIFISQYEFAVKEYF